MIRKTNILVTQEGRESYSNEVAAGAILISHKNNEFVEAADDFDTSRAKESAAIAHSQRAGKLTKNATGMLEN